MKETTFTTKFNHGDKVFAYDDPPEETQGEVIGTRIETWIGGDKVEYLVKFTGSYPSTDWIAEEHLDIEPREIDPEPLPWSVDLNDAIYAQFDRAE